jgi:uncharacterized iron-regulated membrane protein
MTRTTLTGHRAATSAVLVVGGGALAAGTWLGGEHGLAVGLVVFYLVAGLIAYLWAGRDGDVAAIMRVGGDERQRRMDRDATAAAGAVMAVAAVIGAGIEAARHHGDPGAYGVMCAVGGIAYTASLLFYRHRR